MQCIGGLCITFKITLYNSISGSLVSAHQTVQHLLTQMLPLSATAVANIRLERHLLGRLGKILNESLYDTMKRYNKNVLYLIHEESTYTFLQ